MKFFKNSLNNCVYIACPAVATWVLSYNIPYVVLDAFLNYTDSDFPNDNTYNPYLHIAVSLSLTTMCFVGSAVTYNGCYEENRTSEQYDF